MTTIFIYEKSGKYRCLSLNTPRQKHNDLLSTGWKHLETVDPVLYIESLLNRDNQEN